MTRRSLTAGIQILAFQILDTSDCLNTVLFTGVEAPCGVSPSAAPFQCVCLE